MWAATSAWPGLFLLPSLPGWATTAGALLIACGFLLWLSGLIAVTTAYNRDQLMTSGPFALVRHPVYAAWIVLIFPGLALFTRAWLLFSTSAVAYLLFKRLIHVEDDYLLGRFGQAYLDYRQRVNEVIPLPRFRRERR